MQQASGHPNQGGQQGGPYQNPNAHAIPRQPQSLPRQRYVHQIPTYQTIPNAVYTLHANPIRMPYASYTGGVTASGPGAQQVVNTAHGQPTPVLQTSQGAPYFHPVQHQYIVGSPVSFK